MLPTFASLVACITLKNIVKLLKRDSKVGSIKSFFRECYKRFTLCLHWDIIVIFWNKRFLLPFQRPFYDDSIEKANKFYYTFPVKIYWNQNIISHGVFINAFTYTHYSYYYTCFIIIIIYYEPSRSRNMILFQKSKYTFGILFSSWAYIIGRNGL